MGTIKNSFCSECGTSLFCNPDKAPFKAFFPVNFHIEEGKCCMLPDHMKPKMHLNYENRQSDMCDDLPKLLSEPGSQACGNDGTPIKMWI